MGLGYVGTEDLLAGSADPDGGPTIIFEAPDLDSESFLGSDGATPGCAEVRQDELVLTLVSLNSKTAATIEFTRSAFAGFRGIEISCGRANSNTIVLEDPRVSTKHFTIRVTAPGLGPAVRNSSSCRCNSASTECGDQTNRDSSRSKSSSSTSPALGNATDAATDAAVKASGRGQHQATAAGNIVTDGNAWVAVRKPMLSAQLEIQDDSSNGTWVNDEMVGKDRRVPLAAGDRIFVLPSARVGQQSAIGYAVVSANALARTKTAPDAAPAPIAAPSSAARVPGKVAGADPVAHSSASPAQSASNGEHAEQLATSMQCRLCGEAPVHRCATAVPCGHNFDLGCLLAWRHKSRNCPACGDPVRQIVRNRGVDRMVETFLKSRKEGSREEFTLRLLDASEKDPRNEVVLMRLLHGAPVPTSTPLQRLPPSPDAEGSSSLPSHLEHLEPFVAAAEGRVAQPNRPAASGGVRGRPPLSSQLNSIACTVS